MTCAQADEACPHIPGALLRVALPYEDPGQYDKSPQRDAMYTRRSREIATEFAWLFAQLAS
ncbi:MAG: hypothetical protein D6730_11675 [Bacteroidetes bacterium]|nr:MAG: hypothetical protein D6730_11675 [Bacteroidota bacterium]